MKRKEASQIVATLAAAYPNANVNETTSAIYERMLADLDFETTERAVARLLGTSRFLPTIAEIRGAAADLALGPVRSGAEAWLDVIQEIHRVGQYDAPRFGDPLVAEIVRKCGWYGLCTEANLAADRARFIEAYDAAAERKRQDVASGVPLPAPKPAPMLGDRRQRALAAEPPAAAAEAATATSDEQPKSIGELQDQVLRQARRAPGRPEFQRRMSADEIDAAMKREQPTVSIAEIAQEFREAMGGTP